MISVGGKRHSGSSDQMMIVGVLVAFVIVVVVVVVVLVILLPIDVEVAVVNLKRSVAGAGRILKVFLKFSLNF